MMLQDTEKRYRILLAEDDPDDQKIVTDALAAAIPNAHLTMVENGKEAINYLKNAESLPDIFITDIQMPQMTGLECLAQIRLNASLSHLPVVILSTSKEADDILKSKEQGAALYISKPLMFQDWVAEMKQVGKLLA
ncbi:MAG TPA: response regulator [Bdellovibrio sp.]|nr:response regulator [Bdellovibrio sp.]